MVLLSIKVESKINYVRWFCLLCEGFSRFSNLKSFDFLILNNAVHGGFSEWSEWNDDLCKTGCGSEFAGYKTRYR